MTVPSQRSTAPLPRAPLRRIGQAALLLAAAIGLVVSGGCVQRRMTIRSNPPGAICYVDNVEIGVTPVSHDFLYYGTREIKLVRAGYETLTTLQPIDYAWYQYPPLDFISDNLTPWEIRDERDYTYNLVPARDVPPNEVLERAENLRNGVRMQPSPTQPGSLVPGAANPNVTAPALPPGPPPNIEAPSGTLPPPAPRGGGLFHHNPRIQPLPPATTTPQPAAPPPATNPRRIWPTPASNNN